MVEHGSSSQVSFAESAAAASARPPDLFRLEFGTDRRSRTYARNPAPDGASRPDGSRSARSGGLQIRKEQTRTWIVLFLAGGDAVSKARFIGRFEEKRSDTSRTGRSVALAFFIEAAASWSFAGGWLLVLTLTSQQKEPCGRTHAVCWACPWISQQHEEC